MKKTLYALLIGLAILQSVNLDFDNKIRIRSGTGTVYNISYAEARKQFHNLANNAEREDAWICLEGKCYDLGFAEGREEVEFDVEKIITLLNKRHPSSIKAIWVHPHPKKILIENFIYPPSLADVIAHAKLKRRLKEDTNTILESEVYDGKGVWKYDITTRLESELHTKISGPHGDSYPHRFMLELQMPGIKKEILRDMFLSRQERIERYIERMRRLGVILTYASLEINL
ncbi:MAG: hypothetical protein KKF68_00215 [Nanoarchaeota archaeon]|nr:hypothetical protein [Nanoarchaeota archaeon]